MKLPLYLPAAFFLLSATLLTGCQLGSATEQAATILDGDDGGVKSGETLYTENCFQCHLSNPHFTQGALKLDSAKLKSEEDWETTVTRMREKSAINSLNDLTAAETESLVEFLHSTTEALTF